jgi:hypothetical protein
MDLPLADWPRPYYQRGGDDAMLYYVVFGDADGTRILSRSKYRSDGVPRGIDVTRHGPEMVAFFREGPLWKRLVEDDSALAAAIASQSVATVVRGQVTDPTTLNYLRDVIGVLAFCLDAGGVAICDAQTLMWWAPADWRSTFFEDRSPSPHRHVVILITEEADGSEWVHTRGMRKFGRPDLSIHSVPSRHKVAVIDLVNRFIGLLAFGGVISDGQDVRTKTLPSGMKCFIRGNIDDPDFNNSHIEIEWPTLG